MVSEVTRMCKRSFPDRASVPPKPKHCIVNGTFIEELPETYVSASFCSRKPSGRNGLEGRALRLYLLFLQLPPSDLTQHVPSLR